VSRVAVQLRRVSDHAVVAAFGEVMAARGLVHHPHSLRLLAHGNLEGLKAAEGHDEGDGEEDFPEAHMRELWSRMELEFSGYLQDVLDDVEGMLQRGEVHLPLDLDRGELDAIWRRLAFRAAALLNRIGFVDPQLGRIVEHDLRGRVPWAASFIEQAYRFGLAHQAVAKEAPLRVAWEHAKGRLLHPADAAAIKHLRAHAGQFLRPVAYSVVDDLNQRLLQVDREIVRRRTLAAQRVHIHPERLAGFLADLTGARVDRGDGKLIWQGGSWMRDWRRVARTEMAYANNEGHLSAMLQAHPINADAPDGAALRVPKVLVYKVPQATRRDDRGRLVAPCTHCFRIWRADDATPRLYPLDEVLANGENAGPPPKKAKDWTATVGPTHPNDLCGPLVTYSEADLNLFPGFAKQLPAFAGKGYEGIA
jgi:hypothetical protein